MRWFKALPSGRFGPVLSLVWQHSVGLQIIAVYYKAREAIPQPTPQPNQSEETRRRWQTAQVIRAPRKPFCWIRVSPIVYKPHDFFDDDEMLNCRAGPTRIIV